MCTVRKGFLTFLRIQSKIKNIYLYANKQWQIRSVHLYCTVTAVVYTSKVYLYLYTCAGLVKHSHIILVTFDRVPFDWYRPLVSVRNCHHFMILTIKHQPPNVILNARMKLVKELQRLAERQTVSKLSSLTVDFSGKIGWG